MNSPVSHGSPPRALPGQCPVPPSFDVERSTFSVGRSIPFLISCFLVFLLPNLPAQDTLVLKNGRKAACRVIDFTADAIKISYQSSPGAAPADRLIPLADVEYAELAPLPGETEALAQAVRDGRSEPLMTFWVKRLPWLGRPRTNGGELGLTYAELLTRVPTADRMERALKIYQQIETGDWSAGRRGRSQAGRLRVMLRQGRTTEVRPLAEALLQQSGDPRVLIELKHVIAEASTAALAQLEKDHPRWQEEDDLVPRHAQLLNEAFDGYLYPHLFHGAEDDLAARGLWAAAQLSAAQKLTTQAADWSTDLTRLYASQPEASAARAWLEKQAASLPPEASGSRLGPKARDPDEAGSPDETAEEMEDGDTESKTKQEPVKPAKAQADSKAKSGTKPAPKAKPEKKSKTRKETEDE